MSTAADRNASQNPLDAVEVPHPMSKRWIPHKHIGGIAVYCHQKVTDSDDHIGGEYMMSSIVKGTPEQCLAALTHSSSSATILGPATAVDVLRTDGNTQVSGARKELLHQCCCVTLVQQLLPRLYMLSLQPAQSLCVYLV